MLIVLLSSAISTFSLSGLSYKSSLSHHTTTSIPHSASLGHRPKHRSRSGTINDQAKHPGHSSQRPGYTNLFNSAVLFYIYAHSHDCPTMDHSDTSDSITASTPTPTSAQAIAGPSKRARQSTGGGSTAEVRSANIVAQFDDCEV